MYVLLTMILVASPLEVDFVKRINFRPVIIMIENKAPASIGATLSVHALMDAVYLVNLNH